MCGNHEYTFEEGITRARNANCGNLAPPGQVAQHGQGTAKHRQLARATTEKGGPRPGSRRELSVRIVGYCKSTTTTTTTQRFAAA